MRFRQPSEVHLSQLAYPVARSIENAHVSARNTRHLSLSLSKSPTDSGREYISRALSAVSKVCFGTLDSLPVVEYVSDRFANGSAEWLFDASERVEEARA